MPNNNQIDKIEQYHGGNMSAEDMASFEKELAADPTLKAESDFQSTIIKEIKEYRKTQLKTRLNAIDVSPGWIEFVQHSTLVKSFGGVAVATAIGSGVYFFAEKDPELVEEPANQEVTIEVNGPELNTPSFSWDLPEEEAPIAKAKQQEVIEDKPQAVVAVSEEVSQQGIAENQQEEQVAEPFAPVFEAPDAGDISENTEIESAQLDAVPTIIQEEVDATPIEVETKNSRSTKIKYKYYDGKLFLTGNFNKSPYEILEINSASGRRIYLLHQNKYYEVSITDRLSELPEVTDIKLIRELRLIKANK